MGRERLLLTLEVTVLAIGTILAWYTLVSDYHRFFSAGGHIFDWSDCDVPNPVLTPCFYGALTFLGAFAWALALLRSAPELLWSRQHGLEWLLAVGTVFAWSNFAYELFLYGQQIPISAFGCPPIGEAVVHPLKSPCLYGALIFPAALAISLLTYRTRR